jgi:beta-lactamase regulating signal transducer with metallopeptidase domain
VHEHIARATYYFSVHLLYASIVGAVAWFLTSVRGASATTKYWIWIVTAFNFILPTGAVMDRLWASHLTWARPLGAIGGPIWDMTEGRRAVVLGVVWISGTCFMLIRLISRLCRELRQDQAPVHSDHGITCDFVTDGIPVSFDESHQSPSVRGVLYPRIVLPTGLDRLLKQREFDAVLLHELAHARRRDNLIRMLYEVSLGVLWFHPLMWLVGTRMALYRELSCDESVIRCAHGQALVSALAKLAIPQQALFLESTASSHLSNRLAFLAGPTQTHRAANVLLTSLFAIVITAGVYGTIAHTACCFLLKR